MFSHRHRYEAVAVDHRVTGGVLLSQSQKLTVVLYRCSCTDARSKTIDGQWTLSQIRGDTRIPPPATGAPPSNPPLTGLPGATHA